MAKYNGPQLRRYPVYKSTLTTVVVPKGWDGNWTDKDQLHTVEVFTHVTDVVAPSIEAAHTIAKQVYGVRVATGPGELL